MQINQEGFLNTLTASLPRGQPLPSGRRAHRLWAVGIQQLPEKSRQPVCLRQQPDPVAMGRAGNRFNPVQALQQGEASSNDVLEILIPMSWRSGTRMNWHKSPPTWRSTPG